MQNQGQPVTLFGKVGDFPSIVAAARHLGVAPNAVEVAIAKGSNCKGHFVLLSDMPVNCQPVARQKKKRTTKRIPVIWEGVAYPSICAAAKGDRGLWMRIWREVKVRRARNTKRRSSRSNGTRLNPA